MQPQCSAALLRPVKILFLKCFFFHFFFLHTLPTFLSNLKWFGGTVCKSALSGLQPGLGKTWVYFMRSLNCVDIHELETFLTGKSPFSGPFSSLRFCRSSALTSTLSPHSVKTFPISQVKFTSYVRTQLYYACVDTVEKKKKKGKQSRVFWRALDAS